MFQISSGDSVKQRLFICLFVWRAASLVMIDLLYFAILNFNSRRHMNQTMFLFFLSFFLSLFFLSQTSAKLKTTKCISAEVTTVNTTRLLYFWLRAMFDV